MNNLGLYKDVTWNGNSFWHATSTIFLDSIRKTGLGAINPSTDLRLLDLLNFLYNEVCRKKIDHDAFTINRASIEASIAQRDLEVDGIILNYRHQGTYIAASPLRAAFYGSMNKVGSEILEKCLLLLSVLIDANVDPEIPIEYDVLDLRQYLHVAVKPIMIEIIEVADDNLVLENGTDAKSTLNEMRTIFPTLPLAKQFESLQFCNFMLLKPVPLKSLRFYEMDFEGTPQKGNFQYYLSRY